MYHAITFVFLEFFIKNLKSYEIWVNTFSINPKFCKERKCLYHLYMKTTYNTGSLNMDVKYISKWIQTCTVWITLSTVNFLNNDISNTIFQTGIKIITIYTQKTVIRYYLSAILSFSEILQESPDDASQHSFAGRE